MMEEIHRLITEVSALYCGFTMDDLSVLLEHVGDPDRIDLLFDRGFKHSYISYSRFGCGPSSCCINYRKAVNTGDLMYLARASHYIQDLSCIFHTTWSNQMYHKLYEMIIDGWSAQIATEVSVSPVLIDNVYTKAVDLAILTETYADMLFNGLFTENEEVIHAVTLQCVNNAVGYTIGMYTKFLDEVGQIQYDVPVEHSLNTTLAGMFLTFVPFFI